MIVAVSTSSPWVCVALVENGGILIEETHVHAPRNASGAVIEALDEMLHRFELNLSDTELFVSDVGPGSFTGVKVGVTLVKTWASTFNVGCAGISSFDLISVDRTVFVPFKRNAILVRKPNEQPYQHDGVPEPEWIGYGRSKDDDVTPSWVARATDLPRLERLEPASLVPYYVVEPSISVPKTPYRPLTNT